MAEETRGPLLYRPPQAWYFWGAFGAALAIHLTAVAIAQKHEQPAELPPDIPTAVIEATLQATERTYASTRRYSFAGAAAAARHQAGVCGRDNPSTKETSESKIHAH